MNWLVSALIILTVCGGLVFLGLRHAHQARATCDAKGGHLIESRCVRKDAIIP